VLVLLIRFQQVVEFFHYISLTDTQVYSRRGMVARELPFTTAQLYPCSFFEHYFYINQNLSDAMAFLGIR